MYRLKYYSLSKDEKNNLKKEFYQTEFGKSIDIRLKRILIYGILSLILGIFLILTYNNIYELIISISLLVAAIMFLIGSFRLRIKKINNYLIKNKK